MPADRRPDWLAGISLGPARSTPGYPRFPPVSLQPSWKGWRRLGRAGSITEAGLEGI
ncbi:uncharacterized protein BO80DRAFT_429213 [Aspergillus ibericus CBS 121593]|uniref:Uncharacterized protein n=1 Tax=Aspergillus ibericus CBS 121593 TaxID=1448316 RepID=A0A395GQ94_9EURO|nr:hypothetical protein BO80DRAFT_429213 [Aspergillus ibericus CBS 121593]RAK96223.1 hypothetical protein BO80DRAFT_429213 [Aspergillus ibericus CBS 121593]